MTVELPEKVMSGALQESARGDGSPVDLEAYAALLGESDEGLKVAPLYNRRRDASVMEFARGAAPWKICQVIDIPDVARANTQILEDLGNGVTAFELVFQSAARNDIATGLIVENLQDLERLFQDVDLSNIDLRVFGGHENHVLLPLFLALFEARGLTFDENRFSLLHDPLGWLALKGRLRKNENDMVLWAQECVEGLKARNGQFSILHADGRVWHNAGAGQAEELACVFAQVLEYWRHLEQAGAAPESWAGLVSLTLVAEEDQLGTIAKARAARRLWAQLLDACGLEQVPLKLHMETSRRMLAAYDVWNNVLRNTIAVFAASVGGADSIAVLPHTIALGLPDETARRLARNTQSVLLLESNLSKVIDPSAGSGAIESRTTQTEQAAWTFLQEIEAAGGALEAIATDVFQKRIGVTQSKRSASIASGKTSIVGVNEFVLLPHQMPKLMQTPVHGISELDGSLDLPGWGTGAWMAASISAFQDGHGLASAYVVIDKEPTFICSALGSLRNAQGFEKLQEEVNVLVTTAEHSIQIVKQDQSDPASVRWLSSVLGLSGLRVETADWSADATPAPEGKQIVCLVPTAEASGDDISASVRALQAAGWASTYVVAKGVGEVAGARVVAPGCDVVALLAGMHETLGISATGEAAE